jgi:hypothetical protein
MDICIQTYESISSKTSRAQRAATPVHVVIHEKRRSPKYIRGKHSRSTAYLRRENTAAMATQGDAGIPLSLLAEDQQQSFRLLELPAELLKLLTSDNPPR